MANLISPFHIKSVNKNMFLFCLVTNVRLLLTVAKRSQNLYLSEVVGIFFF